MTTYKQGHVKRDPATGAVSIRTAFPEGEAVLAGKLWMTATSNRGVYWSSTADVDAWTDLYVPPA